MKKYDPRRCEICGRRCMAKRRDERIRERNTPKQDTIVAIGYAERQMAASLKMAGKVNTEL